MIIRAETEERARRIAFDYSADSASEDYWLDPEYVEAEEVLCEGDEEVIVIDNFPG